MIYSCETGERIVKQRYAREQTFNLIKKRITPDEFDTICHALNEKIKGTEIQTSSWMPGSDWVDTPFDPIYQKAAKKSALEAARMFGLIVWHVFQNRDEVWYIIRSDPIEGLTYFKSRW